MSFTTVKQHDIKDCGAACLSMICRHYKLKLPMARFRELIKVDNNGANIYGLVYGANKLGLKATALQGNAVEFIDSFNKGEFSFPLIARSVINTHSPRDSIFSIFLATASYFCALSLLLSKIDRAILISASRFVC